MGNHWIFDTAVPQLFLILALFCFFFAFPLHDLILDTDHACSWLYPLHPQPMDRQAGWVFRKSNPPGVMRNSTSLQQGLLLPFAIKTKLAFLSTFLLVVSLVNHWLAGQTTVGGQSRFQCVFQLHDLLRNPWAGTFTLPESVLSSVESTGCCVPSYQLCRLGKVRL